MAEGAVDSLLGRLTGLLIDEAQLLGGIRGDVEFIRDEMESMNGLLLHQTAAQHRDHQVRAWMKQVVGLARDCEAYIELYVRSIGSASPAAQNKGLLGCLRRVVRLLRTVPARHRVATRIRELKVRARDVGDRRLRYGVTVPSAAGQDDDAILIDDVQTPRAPDGSSEDIRRRALLDGEPPDGDVETHVNRDIGRLVEWLLSPEKAPAAAAAGGGGPPLRALPIIWYLSLEWIFYRGAHRIAGGAYEHPSVVSSFGFRARVYVGWKSASEVLQEILEQGRHDQEDTLLQMRPRQASEEEQSTETSSRGVKDQEANEATQLAKKLEECLRGIQMLYNSRRKLRNSSAWRHWTSGKPSASNNATRSGESFLTVPMASLCIGRMKNMEILSHVRVSNSDNEVAAIAQLLKLRKFGVVLHGKNAELKDLFRQIEKLHLCLRSLSIWIDQPAVSETRDAALPSPPEFLQSLNISGITSGIPQDLRQLTKITLSETYLKEDDLRLLGKHGVLRCLRLRHKSYSESDLAFREEEFQSLTFLAVEGSNITKISFAIGAAPKLERIVWSFPTMEYLSGVNHLPELKKLELNGDCNPRLVRQLRQAIEEHRNDPDFKHNPLLEHQEAGTVVAASTP